MIFIVILQIYVVETQLIQSKKTVEIEVGLRSPFLFFLFFYTWNCGLLVLDWHVYLEAVWFSVNSLGPKNKNKKMSSSLSSVGN